MSYVRSGKKTLKGGRSLRGLGAAIAPLRRPAPTKPAMPVRPVAPPRALVTPPRVMVTPPRGMIAPPKTLAPIRPALMAPIRPTALAPLRPVAQPRPGFPPIMPRPVFMPTVTVAPPPRAPISVKPILTATGIKIVKPLPSRTSTPPFVVPTSILPPKDLTIARPLPSVHTPTVKEVLMPQDKIIDTPAGPVAVPAAESPAYSGGGNGGGGGGGAAYAAPSPSTAEDFGPPEGQEKEEAAAPATETAPPAAKGGIPLWILLAGGGAVALWLLTRKK